jgi:hypothetical protein
MRSFGPRLALFLVSLFALLPASALAADIAIFPAETSNLSPSDNLAVGELLAQSYAAASRLAVLSPVRTADTVAHSTSYEGAAQTLGVKEYVRTSTLAVGRLIVITATRYQRDGTFVYQSKMTARSLEDLPAISDRMAKALVQRVDDDEVRNRNNVVLDEARIKPRRASERVFGVRTGVMMPYAKGASYDPHLSIQFDMRFEMDRFFMEFAAGFIMPTRIYDSCDYDGSDRASDRCAPRNQGSLAALATEIGASYFLTDGNAAPYLGVGLVPRILLGGVERDIASMAGYAQLGCMLPRDASTRFYADLRVTQTMIEAHLRNGRGIFPTEFALHAGVGW